MSWVTIFQRDVLPDRWYLSDIVVRGTYFKVSNITPFFDFRGKIAQADLDTQGTLRIYKQEQLRIRDTEEIYRFDKPSLLENRRIAINIGNTDVVPLEAWVCNLKIDYWQGEEIVEGTRTVIVTEVDLLPLQMTLLLASSDTRRGHIVENIGALPCAVYYSLSPEFDLYSITLNPGEKYSWDYPEVYPYKAFSSVGTRLKLYDLY